MVNIVQTWLDLIGTAENATRLKLRLEKGLRKPDLDPLFGPEPLPCPLSLLYGSRFSRSAYADPNLRPALDAWDTGEITPSDMRKWCLALEARGA